MIAVSLNVGGGILLIKPAKLYSTCARKTHYKHDEDGRTAPGVRGHGSVPLSHSGTLLQELDYKHTHDAVQSSMNCNALLGLPLR